MSQSPHPLENLAPDAQNAIESAYREMRASFCGRISTLHLLLGVLNDEKVVLELEKLGLDFETLKSEAKAQISQDSELATSEKRFSNGAKRALERAKTEANGRGRSQIHAEHLFAGLLPQNATWKENWTFGKDLDDGGAKILANVNAKKWGEVLGPSPIESQWKSEFLPLVLVQRVGFGLQLLLATAFVGRALQKDFPFGRIAWLAILFAACAASSLFLVGCVGTQIPRPQKRKIFVAVFMGGFIGLLLGLSGSQF